jgi:hypothetical protein
MSSKRNVRRNECGGKQKFSTQSAAEDTADGIHRRIGGDLMKPYVCTWCQSIHIGHPLRTAGSVARTKKRREDHEAIRGEVATKRREGTLAASNKALMPTPVAQKTTSKKAKRKKAQALRGNNAYFIPKARADVDWELMSESERDEYRETQHKNVISGYTDHSAALDAQLAAILGNR